MERDEPQPTTSGSSSPSRRSQDALDVDQLSLNSPQPSESASASREPEPREVGTVQPVRAQPSEIQGVAAYSRLFHCFNDNEPQPTTSGSSSPSRRSQDAPDVDQLSLNSPQPSGSASASREPEPREVGTVQPVRAQPSEIQGVAEYSRLFHCFNDNEPQPTTSGSSSPSRRSQDAPDVDQLSLNSPQPSGSASASREPEPREVGTVQLVRAQPSEIQGVVAYRRLFHCFNDTVATSPLRRTHDEVDLASSVERWPNFHAAVAADMPAVLPTYDEVVLASSVQRARMWCKTHPAADAADELAVANSPNPHPHPPNNDGVSLDAIIEMDEEQNDDSDEYNNIADVTLTGNDSGSEQSPQRRGLKRRHGDDDCCEFPNYREINQRLLELLECPVCRQWAQPPVPQCQRGHLVCGRCHALLTACPVCNTTTEPNGTLERHVNVATSLRHPCRDGCGHEVLQRTRVAHEASCDERPHRCPAPACVVSSPRDRLQMHLLSAHPGMVRCGCRHSLDVPLGAARSEHWALLALRQMFHARVNMDARAARLIVHVAYIGPRRNAARYAYRVTVKGRSDARQLVYTRAVHSDLENYVLSLSRGDCFQIYLDQAQSFLQDSNMRSGSHLTLTIEIITPETEDVADSSAIFKQNSSKE